VHDLNHDLPLIAQQQNVVHQLFVGTLHKPRKPIDRVLARKLIRDQVRKMCQENLGLAVERFDLLRLIHIEERLPIDLEGSNVDRPKADAVIPLDYLRLDGLAVRLISADVTETIVE
jgi:hypothetical protein